MSKAKSVENDTIEKMLCCVG